MSIATSLPASRLGFLAAFGLIVAMTVPALVPQQAITVASIALTDGLPLCAWLLAAYGLGHVSLRAEASPRRIDEEDSAILLAVTQIAIGLGALSLLTLVLGLAGFLTRPVVLALILIGDVLAIARIYNNRHTSAPWWRGPAGTSWLCLLIAPVIAVMLIGACVLPGLLWGRDDPSGYDVAAYHLQLPREWYELGRVTTLDHNVFSFFPLNVEMHFLLAMHLRGGPWAGMYLAQLMHGAFVTLTIAAVYGAARSRGKLAAGIAAIVCASVPWMAMLGSVAYVEGGLMLYVTLATAWAIRERWALAGACAGLAAGCKLTGVPSAMVMMPLVVIAVRTFASLSFWGSVSSVARNALVFAALAMLVFLPWLIRTAIASHGNPIFPLAMNQLGHGHFDAGQVERFIAAHSPRPDQQSLAQRFAAFWQQVGGDYHYGAVPLGEHSLDLMLRGTLVSIWAIPLWLLLIIPAIWFGRRDSEAFIWLTLILGNTLVWLFATHLQGRFLVQIIPCVAMLVACGIGPNPTINADSAAGSLRNRNVFAAITAFIAVVSLVGSAIRPWHALLGPASEFLGADTNAFSNFYDHGRITHAVYETDQAIVLVGDAKAFWYPIPMARLHYRTVFDVRSNSGFRRGWIDDDSPPGAAVAIDAGELRRYELTYKNLPEIPRDWVDLFYRPLARVDQVPR